MKKRNFLLKTEINTQNINNSNNFNSKLSFKNYKNYLVSPKPKNIKYIQDTQNNSNNKRIINSVIPNKSQPNYTFENYYSNPNFDIYQEKDKPNNKILINNKNNISPKNKHLYNKIQKEINMIKLKLSNDILKNKIQLLHNIGKINNDNDNNNIGNNNKIIYFNNNYSQNNYLIKQRKNNAIKKRNIVLNKINAYIQTENQMKYANMINANSLKNIYYINNNFRINSIQNNENKNSKIPKSAISTISPLNRVANSRKQNNIINLTKMQKKYISTSPNYNYSKSVLSESNNFYINNLAPKSFANVLINKEIKNDLENIRNKNIIQLPNKQNKTHKTLLQGYFDDYLMNNSIINQYKKTNVIKINKNQDKNRTIKINNKNHKTETNSNNELKIENYNSFFINNIKSPKNSKLQTENKIIDFSYIGSSSSKSKNLINKNKIINTINFSFDPMKIIFNKKEQNKPKEEKNNQSNNKNLSSLIDPCDLEEKSVILENIQEEKNKQQKKISFDDTKIMINYNQNDYIRNCKFLYKTKIAEKNKEEIKGENKYNKISHKFISTTQLCNKLKKKNKNLKSNLNKNTINIKQYDPKEALMKLNELISDDSPKKTKIEEDIKSPNNKGNKNYSHFIKKNINFIKKVEECNKRGENYRNLTLSKREMKLLKKKKKNLCHKFRDNPQKFFSEQLCENVIKSFKANMDDSEILKIDKNKIINKLGKIKEDENEGKDKLNNSFS